MRHAIVLAALLSVAAEPAELFIPRNPAERLRVLGQWNRDWEAIWLHRLTMTDPRDWATDPLDPNKKVPDPHLRQLLWRAREEIRLLRARLAVWSAVP
jgi:hypothetical protein